MSSDTLVTERNGFYVWVCNNRCFDYCLTIKPYIALHSIVLCGNDFFNVWERSGVCSHAQLQKRVHKKQERLRLGRSQERVGLTSF